MSSSGNLKRSSYEIDPLAYLPSERERETPAESPHDFDKQVLTLMDGEPYSPRYLLRAIVTLSKGKLDPKYEDMRNAKVILEATPLLKSLLNAAWDKKSFQEIRDLGEF